MTELLPLFPLSIVAFPGESLNLHIFEPRYRQLFSECESEGIRFGIVPYFEGKHNFLGAEMELIRIAKRYENGRMDVETRGIGLIEIHEYIPEMPGKLYPGGEIERLEWDEIPEVALSEKIIVQVIELYTILGINSVPVKDKDDFRTYQVAHKVGFNTEQELHFLSIPSEKGRQIYMYNHLENFIPLVDQMETLRVKAEMNGHFKHVIPPDV